MNCRNYICKKIISGIKINLGRSLKTIKRTGNSKVEMYNLNLDEIQNLDTK